MDQEHSYTAHSTTISAATLARQVEACQQANTALIGHIVELEHERDAALRVVACAVALVSRAEGLAAQLGGPVSGYIEAPVRSLALALAPYRGDDAPPRAVAPGRLCDHCGLPLISAHIADEVIVANGEQRAHVHRVCADYLRGQGWQVAARARGM